MCFELWVLLRCKVVFIGLWTWNSWILVHYFIFKMVSSCIIQLINRFEHFLVPKLFKYLFGYILYWSINYKVLIIFFPKWLFHLRFKFHMGVFWSKDLFTPSKCPVDPVNDDFCWKWSRILIRANSLFRGVRQRNIVWA